MQFCKRRVPAAGLGVRRGLAACPGAVALLRRLHGGHTHAGVGGRRVGEASAHRLNQRPGGRRRRRVCVQQLVRHVRCAALPGGLHVRADAHDRIHAQ